MDASIRRQGVNRHSHPDRHRHLRDFGIGTYIRNLVRALCALDKDNRYLLAAHPGDVAELGPLAGDFQVLAYERPDASFADQVAFPLFVHSQKVDLVHIPLNVVSPWMPRPFVVTVHDMSSLLFEDLRPRQRRYRLYQFRRGLERASRVIAVSNATRRDIEDLFASRRPRSCRSTMPPTLASWTAARPPKPSAPS
jgi:hypothetical protein